MLFVKTKIGSSKIQGIGLFADEFIKKGKLVWKFVAGFDLSISEAEAGRLPKIAKDFFYKYSYLDETLGKYVFCLDDARFFNHSQKPNVVNAISPEGDEINIATRDIRPGEELTCDYDDFDPEFEEYKDW